MDREAAARLLGVDPAADAVAVEQAFRRQARTLHPDLGGDPAAFRALIEARTAMRAPRARGNGAARTRLDVVHTPANPLIRVLQALRDRLLSAADPPDRVQ